jgi:hypothetical protein
MKPLVVADAWKSGEMAVNSDVAAARASLIAAVRGFGQHALTSSHTREKAVRAPFLYRLLPPFIGFYRLLSAFIASHQESFFIATLNPQLKSL